MIYKITFFFSLFAFTFAFAQQSEKETEVLDELIIEKPSDSKLDFEKGAEFPGGINLFRQKLMKNFRGRKIDGSENMACILTFIIERTGFITDIKATGNNQNFNEEVIRSASKIKTRWTPAEINGQQVRYRVRIPLSITFDPQKN